MFKFEGTLERSIFDHPRSNSMADILYCSNSFKCLGLRFLGDFNLETSSYLTSRKSLENSLPKVILHEYSVDTYLSVPKSLTTISGSEFVILLIYLSIILMTESLCFSTIIGMTRAYLSLFAYLSNVFRKIIN